MPVPTTVRPRRIDPRLLRRTRGSRLALAVDAALGIVAALLVLAQAVLIAHIAARSFDGAGLRALSIPLAALCIVVTARAAAAWGFDVVGRLAAADVLSALRGDLVRSRLSDTQAGLDAQDDAELAVAAVAGIDALETVFARLLPQLVLAAAVPAAVLALVAAIDPLSALLMLITLPLVPVFMWLIGRTTERRALARWQELSLLSSHFLDVVRGLPTLRAFNRGEAQAERIDQVGERYRKATMETLRLAFLSGAVLDLAATLGVALIAVTVGVRLVEGDIGFEAALTVLLLAPELYLPLRNLASQFHAGADGMAVAGRLLDAAVTAAPVAAPSPVPAGATVRFDRVSFRYPRAGRAAIEQVGLELGPGETVALVGPSGSGKSTIARLLLRLAEPSDGRILAGGTDIASCDPDQWRREIAWLPQHPTLLHGSIADNIRLGAPEAADELVRDAAEAAGAAEFISQLPAGYETTVGDGGRPLSAGETQRIALARALLRDAPLLILDEPTANLDPASADLVRAAVDRCRPGRTVLVIAHDDDLASRADRIVRLQAAAS
jgi:thiol reductant ABC exporter CydD subunit